MGVLEVAVVLALVTVAFVALYQRFFSIDRGGMNKDRIMVFAICIFASIMLFFMGFTYRANYFTDDNTIK